MEAFPVEGGEVVVEQIHHNAAVETIVRIKALIASPENGGALGIGVNQSVLLQTAQNTGAEFIPLCFQASFDKIAHQIADIAIRLGGGKQQVQQIIHRAGGVEESSFSVATVLLMDA